MLEAVLTFKKGGLPDSDADPFVERVRRCRAAGAGLAWMRDLAKSLLSSGEAEYLLAGEVFDAGGEVEDDLTPWELVGLDKPRRRAGVPAGHPLRRKPAKRKARA